MSRLMRLRKCVLAGMTRDRVFHAARGASEIEPGAEVLTVCSREDLSATVMFFLRKL